MIVFEEWVKNPTDEPSDPNDQNYDITGKTVMGGIELAS